MSILRPLTDRQMQIFLLVREGKGYRAIAYELGISMGVVANTAQVIRRKLQVEGKLKLAALANTSTESTGSDNASKKTGQDTNS